MNVDHFSEQAQSYLERLSVEIGERPVGSAGNRAATDFFAETAKTFGFDVETAAFDCIDWRQEGANLSVGDEQFEVFPSPYSLGVEAKALLVAAESVEALAAANVQGKILLLHGPIAGEPLMPKNFPFYNPEEHQEIVRLLERGAPVAVVCATARNAGMAGGVYPFPMIEDGDFDVPSVTMTDVEGERLLRHVGETATLESRAWRAASQGANVVARKGDGGQRVVVCAHIDTKPETPGAIDNAGGVVVLLLLAQLLADYEGAPSVEIVAFNGEDYYSAPGQQLYLAQNSGRLSQMGLAINIDGAGYYKGRTAFSLYGCEAELAQRIRHVFGSRAGFMEGPLWYQGDHSIFVQNGVPALALTSEHVEELTSEITHTAKDRPEIVSVDRLVATAEAVCDVVLAVGDAGRAKETVAAN